MLFAFPKALYLPSFNPCMNLRHLRYLALFAALTIVLRAAGPSDDEDEDIDYLGYYSKSRDKVTFGYNFRQGAKIHFGNVGEVQPTLTTRSTTGQVLTSYINGSVSTDALRPNEKDANGNQISTAGGRYTVLGTDANGNPTITGDYLSYTAGQTRYWGFSSDNQIIGGGAQVNLSQYAATSNGAGFDGKRKLSNGIELQLVRQLNSSESRIGISLVAGFALNSINSKASGSSTSTLHILTDTYATVGGQAIPTIGASGTTFLTPTYTSYSQSDGSVNPTGYETTVPLNVVPVARTINNNAGPVDVSGIWRVNGAYYAFRFGPQISAQVFRGFSLNAGLGITGAYVGTNDTADESLTVTVDGNVDTALVHVTSTASKFLSGYYANLDASWEANERTGFFAGVNYESLGSFDQALGGRVTKIDLGNTAGIRGGISIKF